MAKIIFWQLKITNEWENNCLVTLKTVFNFFPSRIYSDNGGTKKKNLNLNSISSISGTNIIILKLS